MRYVDVTLHVVTGSKEEVTLVSSDISVCFLCLGVVRLHVKKEVCVV